MLMIPKGQSLAVNRRGIYNTMVRGKKTNGQTMIYIALHRKLKIKLPKLH